MAIVTPPGFLQNAGAVHTAEVLRNATNGMFAGARTAGSLVGRGGVHPGLGGQLAVTQQGSPTMGVTVATGEIYVPGTEGVTQGVYSCVVSSSTNLTVTAANASLPRIDTVCATVQDSAYSGSNNTWLLQVIAGTPASTPVAPTLPADSLPLANIAVAANATQIVNANITDQRQYIASGIITVRTSSLLPNPAFEGMYAYTLDTNKLYFYDGTTWQENYERNRPAGRIYQTTQQSGLTDNTMFAVTFDSSEYDTHTFHSNTTNNSRVTPSVPGYYTFKGVVCFAGQTDYVGIDAFFRINGATTKQGATRYGAFAAVNTTLALPATIQLPFNGSSDYIEFMARADRSGNSTTNTVVSAFFGSTLEWIWERPL